MPKTPIKIGIITLGCPKNTADTESVLAALPVEAELADIKDAEIVLLNTCAFLQKARDEVYEKLDGLKEKKVIVLGCISGLLKEDIFKDYPQVYAVVSGIHYPQIAEIINAVAQNGRIFAVSPEPMKYVEMPGKTLITPPSYAYIKIAEGCDNACAFCLIPRLKGKYRSRPMESILEEAKDLVKIGVKELILVAQDCGLYGMDLYGKKRLSDLLLKLAEIKGDFWIRVLYVYPERIDDELLEVMASSPKICKYLDIPLQHGDPDILKAMRRPYDVNHTLDKIAHIHSEIPDITLRTSLIVGFPGETKEQFENFLAFVKKIDFDLIGVFEYSREKGTAAYYLENQITDKVKKERREKTMLLQQKISLKKNKSFVGKTLRVLIGAYDPKKKLYLGRPMRFAPEIDGQIFVTSKKALKSNQFYDVKITEAEIYDLKGSI